MLICALASSASAQSSGEGQAAGKNGPAAEDQEAHYLRTALFEALALGAGTAWYWIDRERQVADWDFPSLRERFTLDVMRYDNNPFEINFAWHAINGAGYHAFARANGLGFFGAAGAGFLSSVVWEYALEFREKVSINDLIFTTGVGIPLGEFLHSFGEYLNRDPDAAWLGIGKWSAGFPVALTDALDGRSRANMKTRYKVWHQLQLDYRLAQGQESGDAAAHWLHTLHFEGKFVRLPGYRKARSFQRFFRSAEFSSAGFELSESSVGDAAQLDADTIVLGVYQQQARSKERLQSTLLGLSIAYRYRRENLGSWVHQIGVVHLPGLAVDHYLRRGEFSLEMSARLHYDFAGVNSLPLDQWNAAYPDLQGKTILRKQGYNYSYGPSAALQASLRYSRFALGASVWAAYYKSDEGLDRTQELLTADQEGSDNVLEGHAWLRVHGLLRTGYLGLQMSTVDHSSRLDEFSASASMRRYVLQAGVSF